MPGISSLFEAERDRWILFAPVCLASGIAAWFLLPVTPQRQAAVLFGLALALAGLVFSGLPRRLFVAAGLLFLLGLAAADVRSALVAAPRLHHRVATDVVGSVVSIGSRDGGARAVMVIRRDADAVQSASHVRLGFATIPPEIRPGARIAVPAVLAPVPGPALPGAHDPARAAWFQGIAASGRATGPPQLLAPAPDGKAWLARARGATTEKLIAGLPGDAGAIAVALVVGDQGHVRPALLDAMRVSGLAHLLSVSGFHIALVVGASWLLLRRLLALWPRLALTLSVGKLSAICAGLLGTGYALFAGGEVPAVRAAITAWVVLTAWMLGRDPLSLRLVAFAAFAILLARPEALLNPGFQLSFAAVTVLALLAGSPVAGFARPAPEDGMLVKIARLVAGLLVTGFAIELVLGPIALAHFGRTGLYGSLANLVAIPLTSFVIMPLLLLWGLLASVGLQGLVGWALAAALDALAGIATNVAAWPGAALSVPAIPGQAFALIVIGALLLALLRGPLRLAGAPLVTAGAALALLLPRPDIFISGDGRHVAVRADGHLYMLRGERGGFVPRLWREQADAPAGPRLAAMPGASCNAAGCAVAVSGLSLLALYESVPAGPGLMHACAAADIVVSPAPLPRSCAPRWRQFDPRALRETGAVAIFAHSRRIDTVAVRAGDHVWSPLALPGQRSTLLGSSRWTGVLVT